MSQSRIKTPLIQNPQSGYDSVTEERKSGSSINSEELNQAIKDVARIESDLEAGISEEKTTRCRKHKNKFILAGTVLGLIGAGIGGYFLSRYIQRDSNSFPPIAPYVPLTSCPPNITVSHWQEIAKYGDYYTVPGYTLGSQAILHTPLEKENANDLFGLFQQVKGNVTFAIKQVLGKNERDTRDRAFNFTEVAGLESNGVLTTLPNSVSDELICLYSSIYGFNSNNPAYITEWENIFMMLCRTAHDSVCNQLGNQYIKNAKLLTALKNKSATPYVIETSNAHTQDTNKQANAVSQLKLRK